ncbi:hypothetical protein TNCV_640201 [Trichonephila clavipes]|nr:hypothetical protein TNCV_640201 [Trichonephila clavipes]
MDPFFRKRSELQHDWELSVEGSRIDPPQNFTDTKETLLHAPTLYDAPAHSNVLSLRSTYRFTWTLLDLQRLIKAHPYELPNVVLTQPFTRVNWP